MLANELLMNVHSIEDMFIPVDVFSSRQQKSQLARIREAIENEDAIIIFPAGRVSRLSWKGIRDREWTKGAVYFAQKFDVPVLPIFVKGRNSIFFYVMAFIWDSFGTFLLPHQLFRKGKKSIEIIMGDIIPSSVFSASVMNQKSMTRLLMKHVYLIGSGKKGILKTEKPVIHAVNSSLVKDELNKSTLLYESPDKKKVFLVKYEESAYTIEEIARLREISFRKSGVGTGKRLDTDKYDKVFRHLVLWDEANEDVIGSYRIGFCREIIDNHGYEYLYNYSLFNLNKEFDPYLYDSIELGRSFIQHKYWKSNALDLMWKGIGHLLKIRPDLKYMFGSVSMSDSYSEYAKSLVVYYYKKWYQGDETLVKAKDPFIISRSMNAELEKIFSSDHQHSDFVALKQSLKNLGFTIPVLYRSYTELCKPGGAKFLDFTIDKVLSNSVAGLILLDISMLDDSKRERYYGKDN